MRRNTSSLFGKYLPFDHTRPLMLSSRPPEAARRRGQRSTPRRGQVPAGAHRSPPHKRHGGGACFRGASRSDPRSSIVAASDDNQRSHGARRTTASPRRTTRRRASTRTQDRRGYRSVRRKEQWPPMCEVLAQARSPAPRASGSTGRRVIEATVRRKVRSSCFRSQPPRRTDPRAAAPLANRQ
jgi:hypothetical protein